MAGDLISGLLQGLGQGLQYGQQQRLAQEDRKRQEQMAKMQGKLMEMTLLQKQRESDMLSQLMGAQGGPAAPTGDNATTGLGNLLGGANVMPGENEPMPPVSPPMERGAMPVPQAQGSGMDLSKLSPAQLAVASKLSGADLLGAANQTAQENRFFRSQEAQQKRWEDEPVAVKSVDNKGREITTYVPKKDLIGAGGALVSGAAPTESFTYTDPSSGIKYSAIRNKQTGELVSEPVQAEPIPRPASETASKAALADEALKNIPKIRALYMPDGKISTSVIMESLGPGMGKGREAKQLVKAALDARVRAATGAAITAEEWPYYFSMYLPQPGDLTQPGLVERKIDALESFLKSYKRALDPYGQMGKQVGASSSSQPHTLKPDGPVRFKRVKPDGSVEEVR